MSNLIGANLRRLHGTIMMVHCRRTGVRECSDLLTAPTRALNNESNLFAVTLNI